MIVFMDRTRRADHYPWLEWKVRFFVVGASLGVGGMMLQSNWLVRAGIVILILGFFVRFLPGGRGETEEGESEEAVD